MLNQEMAEALEDVGLAPREHQVLLQAASGEFTQIELTRLVGLDKSMVVVTLDALEEAGLVERQRHPTDRRARVISVTVAGQNKLSEAGAIHKAVRKEFLSSLPRSERREFVSALDKLVGGLDKTRL